MNKRNQSVEFKTQTFAYFTLILYLFSISPMAYALPVEPQNESFPQYDYDIAEEVREVFSYELTPYEDALVVFGEVQLEIPAGAVDESVTLTIEKLDGVRRLNDGMNNVTRDAAGYRFGPHPITFNKNIRVSLPYDPGVNESETSLSDLKMWFFNDQHNSWEGLPAENVDTERSIITSLTNHFTDMITSTLTLPESPGPINFDPNSIKELEAADPGSIVPQIKGLEPGSMGGASFSLPLRIPSGRGQATPQLALSYNVNSGNSWLGKGFDLSVPSISTDTRFGLPKYNGSDTYMLGGQKLVLDESMNTPSYKEYVLEQEGSFQRIVRKIEEGNDWWEVTSKDGTLTIYGTGNAWTGKSVSQVFTWYIKSTIDKNGNRVDYSYQQSAGYTYPLSISWTGYQGETAPYKAVFNRTARDDRRSDARGGYMSRLTDRLSSIDIQYFGETFRTFKFDYRYNLFGQSEMTAYEELDGKSNSAYRFEFAYEELEQVDGGYQGFDKNLEVWGSGITKSLSSNNTLTAGASLYTGVSISIILPKLWGFKMVNVASFGISAGGSYSRMWDSSTLMDVDGNGLPDVAWQKGSSLNFFPNMGNYLGSSSESFGGASYVMNEGEQASFNIGASGGAGGISISASKDYSWSFGISTFADIDGDGLVDMVKKDQNSFKRNNGTGFSSFPWGTVNTVSSAAVDESVVKDFENGYYIEEPVRKWEAWKPGTVRVENDISLAQSTLRSEDGVQAILDYPDRAAIPIIISDNANADIAPHEVEVSKNDPLYFALDTMGEIRDSGADDNADCFADDLIWNTRISYNSINLFDDVKQRKPYYFLQEMSNYSIFNALPDYIKEYYEYDYSYDSNAQSYIFTCELKNIQSVFNQQSSQKKTQVRNWQVENGLFIPRVIPRPVFDKLYASLKSSEEGKIADARDHSTLLSLVMLYDYRNETDCFHLDDSSLGNSVLLGSLKKIMPGGFSGLSEEEINRLGYYYLLDRQMEWTNAENPVSEYIQSMDMDNTILMSLLDEASADLGQGTVDGLYLIDKTKDGEKTIYTVLDRMNNTVTLYSGSEVVDSPELSVSGSSYSFSFEGIKRQYDLNYSAFPEQVPEETYESRVLSIVMAGENIGTAPLSELSSEYLDVKISELDDAIALLQGQIDAVIIPPENIDELDDPEAAIEALEAEIEALEAEIEILEGERAVYTDNYSLSDSGTYLLSETVTDEDYLFLMESFKGDFSAAAGSSLYTFSGAAGDEALYLAFISSADQDMFEEYCGITGADLLDMEDGRMTPVPPAAADSGLKSSLEYYRATVELFPYYLKTGGVYTVNTLDDSEKASVAATMSSAELMALSSVERHYIYSVSDVYPVSSEKLQAAASVIPVNSLDGTSVTGAAGETYSYIKFLCFDGDDSVIERVYFPMFNSLSDFRAEEWSGLNIDAYNFADDYNLAYSSAYGSAIDAYLAAKTDPAGEYFNGGYRNWYYGFWSAVHEWNPSLIGSDNYAKDPSYTEDSLGSVETATPPYLVGASLNNYEDENTYYEGINETELSADTWMGTSSTYNTSYVELTDAGAVPVYLEYDFTPYFDGTGRMHPMRKGGLKYYTSPVAQSTAAGGGSNMGEFRKSKTDGTSVTGGVSLGVSLSGGKGESDTFSTRDLRDIDGDRIPDLITADNSGHISVVKGTGSGFGSSYSLGNSYSYLNKSVSESFNFGASLAPGSQHSVRAPDGKELFDIIDPEVPKGISASVTPGISGGFTTSNTVMDLSDMNGDGLPDHVTRSGSGSFDVKYNYGSSFTSSNSIATSFESGISKNLSGSFGGSLSVGVGPVGLSGSISGSNNKTEYQLMDINGDGLPDQVEKKDNTNYFKVRFNRGDSFTDSVYNIYCPDWGTSDELYQQQLSADMNTLQSSGALNNMGLDQGKVSGINTSDIFSSSKNPLNDKFDVAGITDTITSSNGVSFSLGASYSFMIPIWLVVLTITPGVNGAVASSSSNIRMADMNGSGAPDHVLKAPGASSLQVRVNKMASVGHLTSIRMPQGGSYSLEYGRSVNSTLDPHSRWYLSAVEKNDGYEDTEDNIHTYRTEFSYGNAQYDRSLREFYGFDKVIIETESQINDGNGTTTEKYFYNDQNYRKGVEYLTITKDSAGNEVNRVEKSFRQISVITGSSFYRMEQQTTTTTDPDTGNSVVKTENFSYDDDGNITQLVSVIDGAPESQNFLLKIDYHKDKDRDSYIILPKTMEAYWGTEKNSTRLLRKRTASYDGSGNLITFNQYYGTGKTDYNTTELTYDDYGNIETVTDPLGYRLSYVYGYNNRFVTSISSFNTAYSYDSYTSLMDWDPKLGVEIKQTEINGNSMTKAYDSFGRLTEIRTDYDTGALPSVSYTYFADKEDFPWRALTSNKVSFDAGNSETMETLVTVDGLGRITQTAKEGVITDSSGSRSRGWNCSGAVYYDDKARTVMQGQTRFQALDYNLPLDASGFPEATEMVNATVNTYDSLDRIIRVDLPAEAGKEVYMTTDYSIRKLNLSGAAPASGSSEYHQGTIQTDPLGNVTEVWKNGRGYINAIVKRDDSNQILTEVSYQYNLLGELLKTSDYFGNNVLFEYDLLGRTVFQQSPDAGIQKFTYNKEGQLIQKRDSKLVSQGKSISYEYDHHNRLTRVDYPYSEDVVYEYGTDNDRNNLGRLYRVTNGSGTTEYEYGSLGEVTKLTRSINRLKPGTSSESREFSYQSDYLGRMEQIIYPDGEELTYTYDEGGQIISATGTRLGKTFDYVKDIGYDEYGQRVYIQYGDGTETHYTYDKNRRWLDSLKTSRIDTSQTYQNIKYTFDDVGNILQTDNSDTYHHSTVQNYTYDGLYQLTSATGQYKLHLNNNSVTGRSNYTQEFSYDKIGNMLTKSSSENKSPNVGISALNYENSYTYYTDAPHQAEVIGDMYYRYDPNGNVTEERQGGHSDDAVSKTFMYSTPVTGVTSANQAWGWSRIDDTGKTDSTYMRLYSWDEENRLTGTSDRNYTTSYSYDHEGERTVKYSNLGETLYFDSMWLEADTDGTGKLRQTKNIYIGETRIASKLNYEDGDINYEETHTFYYHTDHLSSSNVITDYEGDVYEHMEYTPYGEKWILDQNDSSKYDMIPYRFTGKEWDEETGLYYMSARYQNPETSRWVSADPTLWSLSNPMELNDDNKYVIRFGFNIIESINSYSYVGHNPMKYNDPTGEVIPAAVYAVASYLSAVAAAPDTQYDIMSMSENVAMGDYASAGFDLVGMLIPGLTNTDEVFKGARKLIAEYGDDIVSYARRYLDDAGSTVHHLASDKAKVSGFTAQFRDIFSKAGRSLQDAWNKIPLIGHKGPHGPEYNQQVLDRIQGAVSGLEPGSTQYNDALQGALESVAKDVLPGGDLSEYIYK